MTAVGMAEADRHSARTGALVAGGPPGVIVPPAVVKEFRPRRNRARGNSPEAEKARPVTPTVKKLSAGRNAWHR
ncbi:hypothetical protein [Sphaerisporangium rhizosphaerae]|uniref:Uncharacterized protein n=1 Tax=Sphaerisporangium rhizosphaerae TaxID=2269375 RepID=A0ABW2NZK1_9ACTN